MRYSTLILFGLLILLSCTQYSQHEKAGYLSISEHSTRMKKNYNWIIESVGGSFYDGDVKKLTVSFKATSESFNIINTRSMIVNGIETFLSSINSNSDLIKHLNHYPFTDQDIKYAISLYSQEGEWQGHVFLLKGNLYFYKVNQFGDLEEVHQEPYPEALEKVKAALAVPISQ